LIFQIQLTHIRHSIISLHLTILSKHTIFIMRATFYFFLLFIIIQLHFEAKAIGFQRSYTLEDVVEKAREESPDAMAARHRYRGSYWQHKSYEAGYLPHVSFDATLPNLNRSISAITLPDGSDVFMRRNLATSSSSVSINQTIGLTGGEIFINSGLERIDLIKDEEIETSYLSTPVNIGFRQPIFAYNPYRWERKIEPIRYREARQSYIEELENISINATNLFFDLLMAQINVEINKVNLNNNDTLYQIAKGRYSLGRIAENELLQMELNYLNSLTELEESEINYEAALFRLRSYLGLESDEEITLIPPANIPELNIEPHLALEQAEANRSDMLAYERQKIQAESEVHQARADSRLNANLYAVYGLTQSASEFIDAYSSPLDRQQLVVGVQIPILDWGVSKGQRKMAESNRELINTNVEQALNDFEHEIYLRVLEFNRLDERLNIAAKADTIASKNYEVTRERFLIGNIGVIDLNIAYQEKDRATQSYLRALHNYWRGFYEMRKLTLYNFIEDQPITVRFEEL